MRRSDDWIYGQYVKELVVKNEREYYLDEKGECGLEARGYEPKPVIDEPSRHDSPRTTWQHFKAMLRAFFG